MTNAAHLGQTETRRQALQAAIDADRSPSERNRLGQFATPNALAIEIARCIDRAWPEHTRRIRFADPAIGTGSFFSAALATFGSGRIESSVGVELDPRFVSAARDLWGGAGLDVLHGDFTHLSGEGSLPAAPNLVLANPPYVRHHHINGGEKEHLQRLVSRLCGVQVNGLAGLYVYFVLLATAWMEDGGIAAWLIPSEFMDVNYGAVLRQFFTDRVTLERIHRFDPDNVQFEDALVSSVVLFFRKETPGRSHAVLFTYGGTLEHPAASERVPLATLREARKWTAYPTHAGNDRRTLGEGEGPVLGDFFRIQRGIATGCNKFFILDRDEARRRGLPERYLRPILPSPRHLKTTVIEADTDGYPLLDTQLCVIDCDLPEHVVEARHPALWEYLQTAQTMGIRSGYLLRKRVPWYKQEQRSPPLFLCTYMGRGSNDKQPFRFILNRSMAIGTNLYLMLSPRAELAAMLRIHPERSANVHQVLREITGYELRGEGRVYGGGLNKIEPSELGRISAVPLVRSWPELGSSVRRMETPSLFG